MTDAPPLEVTITHNLGNTTEALAGVAELLSRQLVALDFGDNPDPETYTGKAQSQVRLFNEMRERGAAVIAAYHGVMKHRAERLIGSVEKGARFVPFNGMLCLPLTNAQRVDSSKSFLGNLPPRSCTVQPCGERARGRLAARVANMLVPRSVWSLHNRDVEWLVTNYLVTTHVCDCVWSGIRSFETIDHAGYREEREILAQTTVSNGMVWKKAKELLELGSSGRDLLMFGPEAARPQCPEGVAYHAIEDVFAAMDSTKAGRWLIDRLLG